MSDPRPVGVAMSDGTVRPFTGTLGGIRELAERHGSTKSAVATWWARSRRGLTIHPFPEPIFRTSMGPVFYVPDIDTYIPGTSRNQHSE